jgi:dihydroflavonol-4-reductase
MTIVTVTGPAGHVGANLVRALLARGHHVRVLVHHDRQALEGLEVEIIAGDVSDQASLHRAFVGADLVYHAAAQISISMSGWKQLEAVNVFGTRNVIDACMQNGVRRLVHFSSVDALEHRPFSKPVDEARPLIESRRYPPYARSKAAADEQVRAALERGLDAIILYPSAIVGPNDYRLGFSNAGLLAICSGRLWALIEGGFDWVDVRDVVEGAVQAAIHAPSGSRYILSGQWASLHDLAQLANEINGVRVPRFVFPMWLARIGAPFATAVSHLNGSRPLFTPAALKPLCGSRRISHEHATREFGYHPRPLKETIADTLQWFDGAGLLK